jgi:glyoxalase superfamily protein
VAHYSRLYKVVIDVPEAGHGEELEFWQAAIGQTMIQLGHPEYHGTPLAGQEFGLLVQQVGEGPSRVHVDIHTDDLEAEVVRLERLGAKRVRQTHEWWVMRDPAGLLFCVIAQPPGSLNDDNARRWPT